MSPAKRFPPSTGFQRLNFVTLVWFVINVYANPNSCNQSPKKPSFNKASDEKNDDETTSDKYSKGNENVEGKKVESPSSRVFVNESRINSAATPSKEKQKDEFLNNLVIDFLTLQRKKRQFQYRK